VLEGLDDVPWSDHSHAYGQASDVPVALRAVAAGGDAADDAMEWLWRAIWHQGTIYSASALAVPFVTELAATPSLDVEHRRGLILLLFSIGRGKDTWGEDLDWSMPDDPDEQPEFEDSNVQACRRAVEHHGGRLLDLLAGAGPELWWDLAALVAVAGEPGRVRAAEMADDPMLPAFGALAFRVLATLLGGGTAEPGDLAELGRLDEELAGFLDQMLDDDHADLNLRSELADFLVERLCETRGRGRVSE
jgi:hypothetical protein